jgi:anti-sigma factor RsiW
MHTPLREHLEGYLAGALLPAEQKVLETHLAGCSGCRQELAALDGCARDLRLLRPPAGLDSAPAPGFILRVMQRIDEQRDVPFWALLLDPGFGRRLVFACLMLLAVLGTYVAAAADPMDSPHFPEAVLAARPQTATPLGPANRFGADLNRNRTAVLVTLAADTD